MTQSGTNRLFNLHNGIFQLQTREITIITPYKFIKFGKKKKKTKIRDTIIFISNPKKKKQKLKKKQKPKQKQKLIIKKDN